MGVLELMVLLLMGLMLVLRTQPRTVLAKTVENGKPIQQ